MPTTPYARLLLSIDGGASQAGGVRCAASASVQPVYESTTGWPATPPAYLEIYEYPVDWTLSPSTGWTTTTVTQPSGATATVWRYYGTTPPPAFAAPDLAAWGKIKLQLVVGGGKKAGVVSADMTSQAAIRVYSSEGLGGVAYREETEFGDWRAWVAGIQEDLRIINDALAAVAGGGAPATAAYMLNSAIVPGGLTNGVACQAISTTVSFASNSTIPCSFTRDAATSGTTIDVLDVVRTAGAAAANGDGVQTRWRAPDAGGTLYTGAALSAEIVDVATLGGPSFALILKASKGGTLSSIVTFTGGTTGAIRFHGSIYASAGGRFIVDGNGNITLAAITEAEVRTALAASTGAVAVNSQKITGLVAGAGSGEAVEYDQLNTALTGYVPVTRTLECTAPLRIAGASGTPADLSANRTIDFVPTANVSMSGWAWTSCTGLGNVSGTLDLSAGAGDLTLTIAGGDEVHVLDDEQWIRRTWGSYGHEDNGRKHVTSFDATPQTVLTFTIPASSDGMLFLRTRQVDVTGGSIGTDHAYYERKIDFARRSGGTAVTSTIGVDIVVPDESAAWSCTFDVSALPDVSVRLVGDAANQTEHDVTLIAEYQVFTPI